MTKTERWGVKVTTKRAWIAAVLLFLIAASAYGETSAHRALIEWLAAFNSGDRAKLTAFWGEYNPAWPNIDRELHVFKESSGFTLVKVVSDDGQKLDAVIADGGETFLGLTVTMESLHPPKVEKIAIHGLASQDGWATPFANDNELIDGVRARTESLTAADKFAGTVMIAHHGNTLVQGAWGEADRATHQKIDLDTQFRIGSMNKMFTAVAVLQLIERGKLRLDGTIADYWPDYPNHDLATRVTVRHLLTHTGGTGDIFTPEFDAHRLEIKTLADYAKLYGARALEFEPGSQFRYSNYGYILLGILIEKVSGLSYYDYVERNVYRPAGMIHTASLPESTPVAARATGYMPGAHGWEPNTDTLPWRGTSAGGGYSTVSDLQRFAIALQQKKLISAHWLAEATREQTPNSHYGYGFQVDSSYFGHSGAAPGINGELRIYPKGDYIIAVLSNLEPPAAMQIAAFAGHRLPAP